MDVILPKNRARCDGSFFPVFGVYFVSVKRRRFTLQFKATVAMGAMKGQRTIGELAGLYQVHPSRIAAWKKRLVECSAMAF